jgi:hypothetical protein
MQAGFSDQLRRAISHERLDAYRQRDTGNDNLKLFAHYLCEACSQHYHTIAVIF